MVLKAIFPVLLLARSILCQVVTCNEQKDCAKEGADQCCSRFGFCGTGDGYCRKQIGADGKEVIVSTIETSCEIPGVEFVGFDLSKDLQGEGIKTDGPEECNFKCSDIAECTHYTYDSSSKNEDEELCYLKYGRGEVKSRGAGVVSGSTLEGGCENLGQTQVPGPTVGGAPAESQPDYSYSYPDYDYLAAYCEDPYRYYGYGNSRYGNGYDYGTGYEYGTGYGYGNRGRNQGFREPYSAIGNRGLRDPYPAGGNRGYRAIGREPYIPNSGRRFGQQGRRLSPRQLEEQCLYYCDQENPALGVYEYNMKRNFWDSQDFCRGIGGNIPYTLNQPSRGRFGRSYHWINYNPEDGQCLATRPGMRGNLALPCSSQLNFACQSNSGYPSQRPSLPQYNYLPGGSNGANADGMRGFLQLLQEMALAQDGLGGVGGNENPYIELHNRLNVQDHLNFKK